MKKYIFSLLLLLATSTNFAVNYFVSGSQTGIMRIWAFDPQDPTETEVLRELDKKGFFVSCSPFSKFQSSVFAKASTDRSPLGFERHGGTSSRYFVSGSEDGAIEIWAFDSQDPTKTKVVKTLDKKDQGHPQVRDYASLTFPEGVISFSPDGRYFISGSKDRTIKIWAFDTQDPTKTRLVKTLSISQGEVTSVSFSPDGRYFVSGSYDGIKIWAFDLQDPTKTRLVKIFDKKDQGNVGRVFPFSFYHGGYHSILFSPDGRYFISGSGGGIIEIWAFDPQDATKTRPVRTLDKEDQGHTSVVFSISFSPDGRYFISGSKDKTIKIWAFDPQDQTKTKLVKTLNIKPGYLAGFVSALLSKGP